jgi:integrase
MTSRRKAPSGEGSVYQRTSDGKWCAAVTLPSGRRVVYGATEKEALKARRDLLRDVEAGRPVPLGRTPTLAAYLEKSWLPRVVGEVQAGHLKPRTGDSYRDLLERHVLPTFLAQVKLNALSTDDVRAWQRAKLAEKSQRTKTGTEPRPLSVRTVGMVQAVLGRALNDAMRDELIARNVAALVRPPAGQTRGATHPTEAEITKVLAAAADDGYRAIWLTTMGLGLRRGEVLALRWSRVDLDAGTAVIAAQLGRERGELDEKSGHRRGRLVEATTKTTGSAATLALPAVVATVLREHRAEQLKHRLAARLWVDDDLVFTTNIGTPIEPRNLNRAWHAVCERAGIRPLRIHDLRHAAASFAYAAGADPKEIQAQLRHSRLSTTLDVYTSVFESVKQGTAARMDGVLRRLGGTS